MTRGTGAPLNSDEALQREYYRRTAAQYDELQLDTALEHRRALAWLEQLVAETGAASLLDIGSGTGRVPAHFLDPARPARIAVVGIEPSADLRAIGHGKGIAPDRLIDGDATRLDLPDNSFDIVCAFGVLHHIRDHAAAVREMTRVAARGVFISDANNFGQGSPGARLLKQALRAFGLWRAFDRLRTRGKGYHFSEGDGLFYSYSLFDDEPIVRAKFPHVRFMTTRPGGANLGRAAGSVALFAALDEPDGG